MRQSPVISKGISEALDPKTLLPLRAEQGAQWDPIFWAKLVEELSGHIVKDLKGLWGHQLTPARNGDTIVQIWYWLWQDILRVHPQ